MKKNVLFINKAYSPHIGGIESVVKQYAEFLQERYFDVTVLCIKDKASANTTVEMIGNIKVIRCSSFGTIKSLPISLSFFFIFLKLLFFQKSPDIFHFHEPFPLGSLLSIFLSKKKHKVILTWHSDIIKQNILKIPFIPFQKRLCKISSVITTTSEQLYKNSSIISKYNNVLILPLSIDENEYKNTILNEELLSKLPFKYFLFFGRFSNYKGIEYLLEAFNDNILNDINLIIAGSGNLSELQLKSIKKDNIFLLNKTFTEDEKKVLFHNCYAYIFPSILPSEAFGITQLEAMIYEKPVINTLLPTGVPWVSEHGKTGLTVLPKNALELKNAILKMHQLSPEEYVELSKNAKKRVLTLFEDKIILKKLMFIYENI